LAAKLQKKSLKPIDSSVSSTKAKELKAKLAEKISAKKKDQQI